MKNQTYKIDTSVVAHVMLLLQQGIVLQTDISDALAAVQLTDSGVVQDGCVVLQIDPVYAEENSKKFEDAVQKISNALVGVLDESYGRVAR